MPADVDLLFPVLVEGLLPVFGVHAPEGFGRRRADPRDTRGLMHREALLHQVGDPLELLQTGLRGLQRMVDAQGDLGRLKPL